MLALLETKAQIPTAQPFVDSGLELRVIPLVVEERTGEHHRAAEEPVFQGQCHGVPWQIGEKPEDEAGQKENS